MGGGGVDGVANLAGATGLNDQRRVATRRQLSELGLI